MNIIVHPGISWSWVAGAFNRIGNAGGGTLYFMPGVYPVTFPIRPKKRGGFVTFRGTK